MSLIAEHNRYYDGIILGFRVRKQLAHAKIFRVRPGNGYFGATKGCEIQDQYDYVVPDSITNTEGEPYRVLLAAAVLNWQTTITDEQKAEYNLRARRIGGLSGYNVYISDYITRRGVI